MKKFFFVILMMMMVLLGWWGHHLISSEPSETIHDTIYQTHVVYDIEVDTVRLHHFDSVWFPVIKSDTLVKYDNNVPMTHHIIDTTTKTDSVFVQVPIYQYNYDTTIDGTYIHESFSGYDVRIDTITITIPHIKNSKTSRLGFGVGVGVGYSEKIILGPMLGLMYRF